ncbi:hypothetical protein DICPUDRAFT_148674 [Dictyostelium purpureum]|uniref:Uncharacterized protein n=1 Tax=Dictyostelium purpureum TaxID=5786 RepID=F0ZBQ0_DICPU|nr:uncharacterized protein DICPUDRAFT_148674 [Dictyostelium purpureum]EGC38657.1 hypothetical protein DICPUDRAFT_148674 [Dictyostelium purpureum]|eukprot:XP_003284850.1 hypothetical protein DICPUDRAFT_148674 [Dictyostelium purpureum]
MFENIFDPFKSFQQIALFIIIPLLIGVHQEKISVQVAGDIIVWYIAISFGIYLFKTPLSLYFTVKEKTQLLKEQKNFFDKETYNKKDYELYQLEWRLFIFSFLSPFAALLSWYGLEKFCMAYSLTTLSNLLHPYFIIIAGFVTSYQPIISFMDNFKGRIDQIYPRLKYEPTNELYDSGSFKQPSSSLQQSSDDLGSSSSSSSSSNSATPRTPLFQSSNSLPNLAINQEALFKNIVYSHSKSTEDSLRGELGQFRIEFSNYIKNLNSDNNQLKRDIRDWTSKKSSELAKAESRILNLENQIELLQMLLEKEKSNHSSKSSDIFKIFSHWGSQKMISSK